MIETKDTNPKDSVGITKPPASTVPYYVLAEVGVALAEGARKYGRHNYRPIGVRHSVYYDAVWRHLGAWWEGEDFDPDSGLSHVTKAISALVVLRDSMLNGNDVDDRPPRSVSQMAALTEKIRNIIERYPDPVPAFTEKEHGNQDPKIGDGPRPAV